MARRIQVEILHANTQPSNFYSWCFARRTPLEDWHFSPYISSFDVVKRLGHSFCYNKISRYHWLLGCQEVKILKWCTLRGSSSNRLDFVDVLGFACWVCEGWKRTNGGKGRFVTMRWNCLPVFSYYPSATIEER